MRAPDGHRGLVAGASLLALATAAPTVAATEAERRPECAPEPEPEVPAPAAHPRAAKRLRESDLDLIRTTLQACAGNVSDAAKQLGVSRGLIYRRLKD
jgi:transcriptional regulator of acetoin/glycerol metabolism